MLLAIIFGFALRRKDERIRMIPLQVIGVIMVGLEIAKQIIMAVRGYTLWTLPFHFCSLFIFTSPILAFWRGKNKFVVRNVCVVASAMLLLFMVVYPSLIYSEDAIRSYFTDFLSFHAVTFHALALFELFFALSLRVLKFETKKDILATLITFAAFCVISGTMANVLKTNYNSFYNCLVEPIENMRLSLHNALGNTFGQICYVGIISLGTIALSLVCYGLVRFLDWIIKKCSGKVKQEKVA